MSEFEYHHASLSEIERLGSAFCDEHGDGPRGLIPEAEYDRLFDHLADVLSNYGTFAEGHGEKDFLGYRYVDQIPRINIVANGGKPPAALAAALAAVGTFHRPCAVGFDFYPDGMLILPPNTVFTTFEQLVFTRES